MRILLQPIDEALETLRRDNPNFTFEGNENGVWAQFKPNGNWHAIISRGYDDQVRVFEPGENTLTMTAPMFDYVYHGGSNPKKTK